MLWADTKGKAWADLDDTESVSGEHAAQKAACAVIGFNASETDSSQSGFVCNSIAVSNVYVATVQVFVKTFTGKTITLDVEMTNTVADVKAQIEAKTLVPAKFQRLLFEGKQLDDDAVLFV